MSPGRAPVAAESLSRPNEELAHSVRKGHSFEHVVDTGVSDVRAIRSVRNLPDFRTWNAGRAAGSVIYKTTQLARNHADYNKQPPEMKMVSIGEILRAS